MAGKERAARQTAKRKLQRATETAEEREVRLAKRRAQYAAKQQRSSTESEVLRGGDGQAGFAVRHPNGNHVLPYQWRPSAEYEETTSTGGYYELCIDNSMSHFAAKLVSLYFNSFKRDKWESYVQELESLGVTVANFTDTLQKVDGQVGEMLKYQDQNRRHLSRDWYIVDGNNRYVQYWSLAQCIVIMATSALQVYFVRKLFEVKNVTPTFKPRA
ncbi:transmembrane emp24 domain-containing protein 6 isoform X2 [Dermacentor albipictus]|uniref:transmembrane emp24 domain-containing protein 6 isoform X2 n=1 Tax=Dermacentor albipictus TaxID=60249 RepID=UPI0038FC87BB